MEDFAESWSLVIGAQAHLRTNPKSLADAVVNGKIQPKRTKAMDMRFIGCMTENVNNNSEYIGDQENWTMQITGQNIMLPSTTRILEANT